MELYEEKEVDKKNSKLTIIIGICIALLVVITIAIIFLIMYLQSTITTIKIDGQENTNIEEILYIESTENGSKLYIPIRKMAKFLNYEDYRGDYKNKSEDSSKCYVKNQSEIAMFTLDSDIIIKTRGNSDYEYLQIDEKVFDKDGELYTTIDGIEKAFNVKFSCDEDYKKINIYTMDYLVQYYAIKLKVEEYSDEFTDKKAIFENMLIISKDRQYGVISATDGESILETKYEEISYLPTTTDFLVKSDGKYGVVGKDASIKLRTVYDDIKTMDNQNGLYLVKQNNLYGVVNTEGKIIIEPEYKQIGLNIDKFTQNGVENQYVLLDELIPIKNSEDLWGFFNIKGEQISEFKYTGVGCTSAQTNNSYPALVIQSHKIVIVEKDKHYNLMTLQGEELIPSYILDSVYLKSDTSTGENSFYMTYNNNEKVLSIEEWLTSVGR